MCNLLPEVETLTIQERFRRAFNTVEFIAYNYFTEDDPYKQQHRALLDSIRELSEGNDDVKQGFVTSNLEINHFATNDETPIQKVDVNCIPQEVQPKILPTSYNFSSSDAGMSGMNSVQEIRAVHPKVLSPVSSLSSASDASDNVRNLCNQQIITDKERTIRIFRSLLGNYVFLDEESCTIRNKDTERWKNLQVLADSFVDLTHKLPVEETGRNFEECTNTSVSNTVPLRSLIPIKFTDAALRYEYHFANSSTNVVCSSKPMKADNLNSDETSTTKAENVKLVNCFNFEQFQRDMSMHQNQSASNHNDGDIFGGKSSSYKTHWVHQSLSPEWKNCKSSAINNSSSCCQLRLPTECGKYDEADSPSGNIVSICQSDELERIALREYNSSHELLFNDIERQAKEQYESDPESMKLHPDA